MDCLGVLRAPSWEVPGFSSAGRVEAELGPVSKDEGTTACLGAASRAGSQPTSPLTPAVAGGDRGTRFGRSRCPQLHTRARTHLHAHTRPGQGQQAGHRRPQPVAPGTASPARRGVGPSPWHPEFPTPRARLLLPAGSTAPGPHSPKSRSQTSFPQGSIYGRELWQLSLLWMENLSNYYEVKAFRQSGRAGTRNFPRWRGAGAPSPSTPRPRPEVGGCRGGL